MQSPLSIPGGATVLGTLGVRHGTLPQPCQQVPKTAPPNPTKMCLWVLLTQRCTKGSPGDLEETLTTFRLGTQRVFAIKI